MIWSYQGVKRLFDLAYNNTEGDNKVSVDAFKKYFLPRVKIQNYNVEIDGRNFYDQPINDSIKQYGKIKTTEEYTRVIIYYILEQSKETKLEFSKGTTKVL